jgi:23S rRNA (uracil1939-C5)-methyltransferase
MVGCVLVQQGQLAELQITALAAGGDGVGRLANGCVVFVSDAVPGDHLEVRLVRVKKGHAFGKISRLLEPSPQRVRPPCIVADRCGSCQWQAVDYPSQLAAKQAQVIEALTHLGGFLDPPVAPVLPQIHPLGYRNKSTFPIGRNSVGELVIGYYRKDSHRIVNLNACPVQDERLNPLLIAAKHHMRVNGWTPYDEVSHRGTLRHLALRVGERTGEMLLTLVVRDRQLPGLEAVVDTLQEDFPALVGICINENSLRGNAIFGEKTECIAGHPYLEDILDGLTFAIEPTTFFQIDTSQAEVIARLVVDAAQAQPEDTLVDAYCGIGTLTLPLARTAGRVIGIENHPRSIEQAKHNAQKNGFQNCHFVFGTVEEELDHFPADILTLDPPRRGCEVQVLEAILKTHPRRVVYVSCNPATLARDLKILVAGGYALAQVQPVDLFAQTHHVESIAILNWQSR